MGIIKINFNPKDKNLQPIVGLSYDVSYSDSLDGVYTLYQTGVTISELIINDIVSIEEFIFIKIESEGCKETIIKVRLIPQTLTTILDYSDNFITYESVDYRISSDITLTICGGTKNNTLPNNGVTIDWSGPNGFTSDEKDINVTRGGDYDVTIIDCNNTETGDTILIPYFCGPLDVEYTCVYVTPTPTETPTPTPTETPTPTLTPTPLTINWELFEGTDGGDDYVDANFAIYANEVLLTLQFNNGTGFVNAFVGDEIRVNYFYLTLADGGGVDLGVVEPLLQLFINSELIASQPIIVLENGTYNYTFTINSNTDVFVRGIDGNVVSTTPTPTMTSTPTVTPTATPTETPTVTPTDLALQECGEQTSFSGTQGYPVTVPYNLGTDTGIVNVVFDAFGVPDRFIGSYDGINEFDTGYRGAPSYDFGGVNRTNFNNSLTGKIDPITTNVYPDLGTYPEDGYPRVSDLGAGSTSFEKLTASPTTLTISVYGPMAGTAWNLTVLCPGVPIATPTPTETPTPTPTETPTVTPTETPSDPPLENSVVISVHTTTCSDFCGDNYLINNSSLSTNDYLNTVVGDTIQGATIAGFYAYSDNFTDTATGPFRIAETDANGLISGIFICDGGACTPL